MSPDGGEIVLIEARFYEDIANSLGLGASAVLEKAGHRVKRVAVPGVFEIPAAMKFELAAGRGPSLAGIVTLGCVIRGETDHYDHICREMSRAIMDLILAYEIPHGFGVLTCETSAQAKLRADVAGRDVGGRAARACLRMIEIKADLGETR